MEEKFDDIKRDLNNNIDKIISEHAKQLQEQMNNKIKWYAQHLITDLIADKDISQYGFYNKDEFYQYINFWDVRNKIRKDFHDELMTDLMNDLKRKNNEYKKAIDVITKILKENNEYGFKNYRKAVEELESVGIKIND
jgi:hypothetical protein